MNEDSWGDTIEYFDDLISCGLINLAGDVDELASCFSVNDVLTAASDKL